MLDGHTRQQACYKCGDQSNLQFHGKHLEEPGQKYMYQRLIQHWTGMLPGKSDNTSRLNGVEKFHMSNFILLYQYHYHVCHFYETVVVIAIV